MIQSSSWEEKIYWAQISKSPSIIEGNGGRNSSRAHGGELLIGCGNSIISTEYTTALAPFKFLVYIIYVYVYTLAYYISYFSVGMMEYYDEGT